MASEKAIAATPKSMRVGPFVYGISYDGQASYDHDYYGVCLFRSKRVQMDPMQADTELPQTLLHEAIHALGHAYEIREWSRHKTDSDGYVVDKIDLMASALLQWLRSNPEIVAWLTADARPAKARKGAK